MRVREAQLDDVHSGPTFWWAMFLGRIHKPGKCVVRIFQQSFVSYGVVGSVLIGVRRLDQPRSDDEQAHMLVDVTK